MPAFHCFEKYIANGYVQSEDDAVKEYAARVIHEFEEIIKNLNKWHSMTSLLPSRSRKCCNEC